MIGSWVNKPPGLESRANQVFKDVAIRDYGVDPNKFEMVPNRENDENSIINMDYFLKILLKGET